MAQSSCPKDAGREKAAEVFEPDRKSTTQRRMEAARVLEPDREFTTQRRLEHQRGTTEPKLDCEMAQKVENYTVEVTKLRRELEAERRRNATPPLVQGTISFSVESEERTLEVNASTRTDKRTQVNEDRKDEIRDENSVVTLAQVHQSKDPPAERGDLRITDSVIHEVFEYNSGPRRVTRVLCDGISATWTDNSKERVAGVAQPKDPPSMWSSLYMESENSDGYEIEFEELRPPDPDLTSDEKGGVRQASLSFDVWMDLARGQFHRERSATRETEMQEGKIAERDEVRPSVAGALGSARGKLSFKDDPMMSSESEVDRLTSGGRKSKKTRT
ncbi:uncharacterized protein EI90DRAFT_3018493 [Cantharellus anzutake]|uniref:uncharacterized protein n=1 Tax=Cantharellus anzutake TaxID=1750568 RepID=UPI00190540C5|nr:uncharacterized protein EI90DRAFT_3018493 [Cantharellus anzutake]KAF8326514.1 hypothetical protein EI90DRAFT_3018493 [Cantharellus anzutake]